ncbi:hypothetical protein BDF19DRAFT_424179 [Syncephalis fuscata]|nr:hypothetical protein BDF19DRAFT_424179 [Syncephalis fuscata]
MAQPSQNVRDTSFNSSSSDSTQYFESSETAVVSDDESRPSSPKSPERRPSVSQKLRDKVKELALAMDMDDELLSVREETDEDNKAADVTEATTTTTTAVTETNPSVNSSLSVSTEQKASSNATPIFINTNLNAVPASALSLSPTTSESSSNGGRTPNRKVVTTPEFDRYLERRRLEATQNGSEPSSPTTSMSTDPSVNTARLSRHISELDSPLADTVLTTLTEEDTDFSELASPRMSGIQHTTTQVSTGGTQKSQSSSSAVHVARIGKLLPVLKVFQRPAKPPRPIKDRHSIVSSNDDNNESNDNQDSWSGSSTGSGRHHSRRQRGFLPWSRKNKRKGSSDDKKRYSEVDPAIMAIQQTNPHSHSKTIVATSNVSQPVASTSRLEPPTNNHNDSIGHASNGSWVTDRSDSSGEADHTGLGEELSRNIPVDNTTTTRQRNQSAEATNNGNTDRLHRQRSHDSIDCASCLEYTGSMAQRRSRSRASSLNDLRHEHSDEHTSDADYMYPRDMSTPMATSPEPPRRFSSDTAETRSLDRALSQNERHRRSLRWRSDDHYSIAWRDASAARRNAHNSNRGGDRGNDTRRDRGNVERYWADRTLHDRDPHYPSTRRTQRSHRQRTDIRDYDTTPLPSRCELCLEYSREMRVLPCRHTYCRNCLQRMVDDNDMRQRSWSSLPQPNYPHPHNNIMMPTPPHALMMPGRPPFAPGLPLPGFFPHSMPTPNYPMGATYRPGAPLSHGHGYPMMNSGIGINNASMMHSGIGDDITMQRMEEGEAVNSDNEDEAEGGNNKRKKQDGQKSGTDQKNRSVNAIERPVVRLPSKKRLYLRLVQLIASIGAFGFLASAKPHSGSNGPVFEDNSGVYFLYVLAAVSFCLAIAHVVYFYLRLKRGRAKFNQWYICGIDFFMFLFWGAEVGVLLSKNSCPSGTYNGWCTFFNVAIFWGFASLVAYGVAVVWDLIGIWVAIRRRSQQRQPNELQTRTTIDTNN